MKDQGIYIIWLGFVLAISAAFLVADYNKKHPEPAPEPVQVYLMCYNDERQLWDRCRQGLKNADGKTATLVTIFDQQNVRGRRP